MRVSGSIAQNKCAASSPSVKRFPTLPEPGNQNNRVHWISNELVKVNIFFKLCGYRKVTPDDESF